MIRVALSDGSSRELRSGACVRDVAREIEPQLGESMVCASIDGELRDVRDRLERDCALRIYTRQTAEGYKVLCHTAAHVVGQAVARLFPETILGRGAACDSGFYHDFEFRRPPNFRDLERIETEAARIVHEDLPIERQRTSKGDARSLLVRLGEIFKLELLEEIDCPSVFLYSQGEHVDLCRGPHAPSTGRVPIPRLTGFSVSRWRGDPHAEALHRIHGTIDRGKDLIPQTGA